MVNLQLCVKRTVRLEHTKVYSPMPRGEGPEGEDEHDNNDLVFLRPEEDFPVRKSPTKNQGASPVLRRSNRKRKLTALYSDMSKGSGSKKKKSSRPRQDNDPVRSMPKISRTPQQAAQAEACPPAQETS